ncbi:MAG: hypothetical protein HZA90_21525 [Verrucomicrobia bacterium]|nr:hypothetical protein [Verrucomicrobiota bacterium]
MKRLMLLAAVGFLALVSGAATGAESATKTYYLQLVRGNDEASPPASEAKPVGAKLSKELRAVCAWKHYWEVARQELHVSPGQKAKARLNKERAVEIDLAVPGKRRVTAFKDGRPVITSVQPANKTWTVIGGDRDPKSAWFIIVRRDKPTAD